MELPVEIKNKIDELSANYKVSDLISSYQRISSTYLKENNNGERIINNDIDVLAYAISRMPATFGALSNVLLTFKNRLMDPSIINSVIDLGSGTGNTSIAFNHLFNNSISITSIEREEEMISLAKNFTLSNTTFINKDLLDIDINKLKKSDAIVESYALNELTDIDRKIIIDKMIELTNNYLIFVEPGTPHSYKTLQEIRSYLLNKGLFQLGPCPHNKPCPLSDSDWCHFVVRISRNRLTKLIKGGDAPYEDEKYSYLIFAKDLSNVKQNDSSIILRHPLIHKGKVELVLCNSNGERVVKNITKSSNVLFKIAKKSKTGEYIEIK